MSSAWAIRRYERADAFLEKAKASLLETEAEHHLLFGLTAQLLEGDHAIISSDAFTGQQKRGFE